MRVAFGSLPVSFGPVDLAGRHDTLSCSPVFGPGVYATVKKLPARPIHHRGLKGPAQRLGRDSRIRDVAISGDIKDGRGLPDFALALVVVPRPQCTRIAVFQSEESCDIAHAAISMHDPAAGHYFHQ